MLQNNQIIYTSFLDLRFKLSKAKGDFIWDEKGKKYIDFTSSWNTINLGWNNPEIAQALQIFLKENIQGPMWASVDVQEKYAKLLTDNLPKSLKAIGRTTGGMESNLEAMKLARVYTKRKKILGFIESWHGQSTENMALSYKPEWMPNLTSKRDDLLHIPYPQTYRTTKSDTELLSELEINLETILSKKDVAAVITEMGILSGWGSVYLAPNGFLKLIRKLTKKYGTLLILDEVGSGFSRLGALFGMDIDGVVPDMVTFAKGITNGVLPMGAMVTTDEIAASSKEANLQSTFGWLPLPCAAAKKTLEIHLRDKVWEKSKRDGEYLKKTLTQELRTHPFVGDVRGIGMLIGIDFVKDKISKEKNSNMVEKVMRECWEKGLHVVCDHESTLQLMPPLTIDRKILDNGMEILVEIVNRNK